MNGSEKLDASHELLNFSGRALKAFNAEWGSYARSDQMPPEGDWRVWLFLGGRGAGKTRAGAEWVRARALGQWPEGEPPARRIALVGPTLHDVRQVMVEGVSGLLQVHSDDERPVYEPSLRRLTWRNGTVAQIFSAEEPDSLRGPAFDAAWCDGPSNFARSSVLRYVNRKRFADVPARLALWNKAGGKVLRGLSRRRAAEGALFLAPPTATDDRHETDEMHHAGRQMAQRQGKTALQSTTNRAAAGLTLAVVVEQLGEMLSLAERAASLAPEGLDWHVVAWPLALSLGAVVLGLYIVRERMKKSTEYGV